MEPGWRQLVCGAVWQWQIITVSGSVRAVRAIGGNNSADVGRETEEKPLPDHLISPHGGELVDPLVDESLAVELREESRDWPSWDLTPRQQCDLELLCNGGFSPLRGFLNEADYTTVRDDIRLADGTLLPMPGPPPGPREAHARCSS